MTQPNKNGSQRERILWYMQQHPNKPIPCYKFPLELKIMRYWARFFELQKEWHPIQNKRVRKNKKKLSSRVFTTKNI